MYLSATVCAPCTLLTFLRQEMGVSSTLVKRLKWQGTLLVNGEPAHTDRRLMPGDVVAAELLEHADGFLPEDLPLDILYEDEHLIALDKPAGVLVHPSRCRNSGTLANGLLHYYERTGQACAIHPISRLDRDTLGVVLLAKSAHLHALFCRLHREHAIRKTYEALVFGAPDENAGVIDLPIARCAGGSLLREISPDGKPAVSEFAVLERRGGCAKLRLHPVTGRTHQLRLHCLASGFPILGDPQYTTPAAKEFSDLCGLLTQQLCAASLEFIHPVTNRPVTIRSRQALLLPDSPNCANASCNEGIYPI